MHRSKAASLDHFVATPVRPFRRSTVRRKNDTKQHSFIQAFLPRSADMRTTIWRDDGALAGGARIAMPVAVHAVAELAVSLFMK
jgi:hypothetical protein